MMLTNRSKVLVLGAAMLATIHPAVGVPTHLVEQKPAGITNCADGVVLVDFGRVAFGNSQLTPPTGATNKIKVHFGEAMKSGRIDRKPPGTVRYVFTEFNTVVNAFHLRALRLMTEKSKMQKNGWSIRWRIPPDDMSIVPVRCSAT
jgi:hypothetical protein